VKYKNMSNWNVVDENGQIAVPDYLDPLVNKIGFQINFHKYSGLGEGEAICNIAAFAEEFFTKHFEGEIERLKKLHKSEAIALANWLSNTVIAGRTIERLWNDYQLEINGEKK